MVAPFTKLFCIAAFASVALAGVTLNVPSTAQVGGTLNVQVKVSPASTPVTELGLALGVLACGGSNPCTQFNYLGDVGYTGKFISQWVDGEGVAYQNVSVPIPNSFVGPAQITYARFSVNGNISPIDSETGYALTFVSGKSG